MMIIRKKGWIRRSITCEFNHHGVPYNFPVEIDISEEIKRAKQEIFNDLEKELNYILAYHCNCNLPSKINKNVLLKELKDKHLPPIYDSDIKSQS